MAERALARCIAGTALISFALGAGCGNDGVAPSSAWPPRTEGNPQGAPDVPEELDHARSFVLALDEVEASPGEEFTYCMKMPIPRAHRADGGGPMFLSGWRTFFSFGTHHFFTFYNAVPPEPMVDDEPAPCLDENPRLENVDHDPRLADLKAGPGVTLGAPEGEGGYFLRPGYATRLSTTEGFFVTDLHVVNFTTEPLPIVARMHFFYYPSNAPIEYVTRAVTCRVPEPSMGPGETQTHRARCILDPDAQEDLEVVMLSSQAGVYLERLEQYFYDGERDIGPIYESTDWDSPKVVVLDEPLRIGPGQGISIDCTYNNPTEREASRWTGPFGEVCAAVNTFALPAEVEPFDLGAAVASPGEQSMWQKSAAGALY